MSTSAPAGGRSAEGVVAASIAAERLLEPTEKVLVAFSGGADSTALALLLQSLGYPVVLAHVDHRMRPDSGVAAEHCRAVAAALGLPIRLATAEVPCRSECDARRVRYQALEAMATA